MSAAIDVESSSVTRITVAGRPGGRTVYSGRRREVDTRRWHAFLEGGQAPLNPLSTAAIPTVETAVA